MKMYRVTVDGGAPIVTTDPMETRKLFTAYCKTAKPGGKFEIEVGKVTRIDTSAIQFETAAASEPVKPKGRTPASAPAS